MSINLITIKQLPVLEDKFKSLGEEIDNKVEKAKNLVCTEDTCKDVKKVRTTLNKEAKVFDDEFKNIRTKVLEPWEKVEIAYKSNVKDKYRAADEALKLKIDEIETSVKAEKEQKIKAYFDEYLASKGIDFVSFENAKINVTLSASKKSLKEQATEFIDHICDDLALIETQDHKAEIMVEYKRTLNCSLAITTVANRIKAVEEQKQREEQRRKEREEQAHKEAEIANKIQAQKPQEHLQAPTIEKEVKEQPKVDKLKLSFTVIGTKEELKKVKEFLENGGYDYE